MLKIVKNVGILGVMVVARCLFADGGNMWFMLDGGQVRQTFNLDTNLTQYFVPPSFWGAYCMWNNAWKMSGAYGCVSFIANAMNDIHVGISRINPNEVFSGQHSYLELVNSENFYEIVIGGWANTRTVIRKGSQAYECAAVQNGLPANELIKYKVILYQNSRTLQNTISVYYCYPTRKRWTLLISYQDPEFIPATQRWVSFTNWDNPIVYESIKISDATELPSVRQ